MIINYLLWIWVNLNMFVNDVFVTRNQAPRVQSYYFL